MQLIYTKKEISAFLKVHPKKLGKRLDEIDQGIKTFIGWQDGRQCFSQDKTFYLLKTVWPRYNDDQIMSILEGTYRRK